MFITKYSTTLQVKEEYSSPESYLLPQNENGVISPCSTFVVVLWIRDGLYWFIVLSESFVDLDS